jgi:hypothetical protein
MSSERSKQLNKPTAEYELAMVWDERHPKPTLVVLENPRCSEQQRPEADNRSESHEQ